MNEAVSAVTARKPAKRERVDKGKSFFFYQVVDDTQLVHQLGRVEAVALAGGTHLQLKLVRPETYMRGSDAKQVGHFAYGIILFIGLPGLVAIAGCTALIRTWRREDGLRQDLAGVLALLSSSLALLFAATVDLLEEVAHHPYEGTG